MGDYEIGKSKNNQNEESPYELKLREGRDAMSKFGAEVSRLLKKYVTSIPIKIQAPVNVRKIDEVKDKTNEILAIPGSSHDVTVSLEDFPQILIEENGENQTTLCFDSNDFSHSNPGVKSGIISITSKNDIDLELHVSLKLVEGKDLYIMFRDKYVLSDQTELQNNAVYKLKSDNLDIIGRSENLDLIGDIDKRVLYNAFMPEIKKAFQSSGYFFFKEDNEKNEDKGKIIILFGKEGIFGMQKLPLILHGYVMLTEDKTKSD